MARPDCFKCRYLIITHEKERPYACGGMGFKSRQLPSVVVRRDSGAHCRLFTPKPGRSG